MAASAKLIFLILGVYAITLLDNSVESRGINGGLDCAVCTVVVGLSMQVAQIQNETVIATTQRLCAFLPNAAAKSCKKAVQKFESVLLSEDLYETITPDVFCYGVGLCYKDPGENYCHLFPEPKTVAFHHAVNTLKSKSGEGDNLKWSLCSLPGVRDLCDDISRSLDRIQPAVDLDADWFSTVQSARGTTWRGRDCDDTAGMSYPGRQAVLGDAFSDSNCNGIHGIDASTATAWETLLCAGPVGRGLIYMGDSVGAHFHFPELWMDPVQVARIDPWSVPQALVENVTQWILNEGDWPQLGFATGFQNNTTPSLIQGTVDSIYLRMRARNRCNHRDYQNLSRNGAATNTVLAYMQSVARNATKDLPVLFIYGLYGNDVCNNVKDTIENMTTPEQLRSNVMAVMEFMDTVLPEGSHVLIIGLVDANFIYPAMQDRVHPLGRLHNDITYADLYEWFSCMQIGPCNGWMTPNETLRAITSKASRRLSLELKKLTTTQKFHNFKLHYLDNPLGEVMDEWVKKGYKIWQLIDPIDSLHPSQLAQPLITDVLWKNILKKFPYIVGDENPHNAKMQELFGDQGGH